MDSTQLIELTADIVAAHVSNNLVAIGDVGGLVVQVHAALSKIDEDPGEPAPEALKAIVSVRASLKPDYLVCMACGQQKKTLKRHLLVAHQMTPDQYRSEFDLPRSYPMIAPNYSATRRELAHRIGLGRKTAGVARKRKASTSAAPKSKRPSRS